jgi:hypothetical protein
MPVGEKHPLRWSETLVSCFCAVLSASLFMGAESFRWEWRESEYLKETLREAKLTDAERTAIAKAIANQLGPYVPDMKYMGIDSEQQLKDAILDTRVEMVDLNGDDVAEVIAQGTAKEGCSPTGNCPFWVFQKSGREYRLLVSLPAIQTFQIQRSRSDGFRDIVVEMHGSATQRTLRLLRYSRSKYHEAGCYHANWSVLEGDTVRDLKEPRLTPCKAK